MNCTENSQLAIGYTEAQSQYVDSFWQLISHIKLQKKCVREMNTIILLVSMVKDRSLDH